MFAIAKYNYTARNSDELSFLAGQIIEDSFFFSKISFYFIII